MTPLVFATCYLTASIVVALIWGRVASRRDRHDLVVGVGGRRRRQVIGRQSGGWQANHRCRDRCER